MSPSPMHTTSLGVLRQSALAAQRWGPGGRAGFVPAAGDRPAAACWTLRPIHWPVRLRWPQCPCPAPATVFAERGYGSAASCLGIAPEPPLSPGTSAGRDGTGGQVRFGEGQLGSAALVVLLAPWLVQPEQRPKRARSPAALWLGAPQPPPGDASANSENTVGC